MELRYRISGVPMSAHSLSNCREITPAYVVVIVPVLITSRHLRQAVRRQCKLPATELEWNLLCFGALFTSYSFICKVADCPLHVTVTLAS